MAIFLCVTCGFSQPTMQATSPPTDIFHFGTFQLDLKAGELHKAGVKVKLQDQPFRVLALLVDHAGQVVTREELRQRVWPSNVYVDFDQGLNNAIKKVREALGDSADSPRFIETVASHGYRFVAPVSADPQPPAEPRYHPGSGTLRTAAVIGLATASLFPASYCAWHGPATRARPPSEKVIMASLPSHQLCGELV